MQRLTKLLFRVFVLFLPTQLAYHFWPDWALVFGIRVDYLAPSVYLTDLLAGFLIFLYFLQKKRDKKAPSRQWIIVLFFVFLNILFAKIPPAAFFKWLKILELYLIFRLARDLKWIRVRDDFLKPLFLSSFFFSLIGIAHFFTGRTLGGPLYFFGERSFDLLTPGISLVKISGKDFLRAYSTFPHPNSLAGFLAIVLIFLLSEKVKTFSAKANFLISSTVLAAFALSFSLSAWVSLPVAFFLRKIRKKNLKILFLVVGTLSAFLLVVGRILPLPVLPETVEKRIELAEISGKIFLENPILGIGLNNFTVSATRYLQPVHNIFLLALAETGLFGTALFFWIFHRALKRGKASGILISTLFVLFVGLFDHYFLTLQQNLLLFSIILGYSQRRNA